MPPAETRVDRRETGWHGVGTSGYVRAVIEKLTTRERDVIRLVSVGASNKEVADRLGLRASTVKSHVSSILWKLQAGSRTEAAVIALRAGLVEVPPPDRQRR